MPKTAELPAEKRQGIIDLVRPLPQIWDAGHPKFLDAGAKAKLFETIGKDTAVMSDGTALRRTSQ